MENEKSTQVRILAREVARPLTVEEIEKVSGGGNCRTVMKVTRYNNKNDAEAALECDL